MRSWIDINQRAFEHNVSVVKTLLSPSIALGMVLKANAYGHGIKEVALLAENNTHISWLIVSTLEEALLLRSLGCKKEILVLAYLEKELIQDALQSNIVMSITDTSVAETIAQASRRANIRARVHIKIDMGMNRLGIFPRDVMSIVHSFPELKIEGLCAHIGITSDPDIIVIESVIESFHALCRQVDREKNMMWHIGASGLVWSEKLQDMVRAGTILYGSWKSEIHRNRVLAKSPESIIPIISWKAIIMQIKHIVSGDVVGYDYVFRATKPMRIAVLPIGYADGYPRSLSQKGLVWVQGRYARVLGLVSMNLMAIDISDIPDACVGSEVWLMGDQEDITPYALAQRASTNPNDITCGLRAKIKREIVYDFN